MTAGWGPRKPLGPCHNITLRIRTRTVVVADIREIAIGQFLVLTAKYSFAALHKPTFAIGVQDGLHA